MRWSGRHAVVVLPEQLDLSNASLLRERLLMLINRGAQAVVADMAATVSCDHSGADALLRAYTRACASGTELRLVTASGVIRRTLGICGLDRLVSIYPTLEAALAASPPGAGPPLVPRRAQLVPEVPGARQAQAARTRLTAASASVLQAGVELERALLQDAPAAALRQVIEQALAELDATVGDIHAAALALRDLAAAGTAPDCQLAARVAAAGHRAAQLTGAVDGSRAQGIRRQAVALRTQSRAVMEQSATAREHLAATFDQLAASRPAEADRLHAISAAASTRAGRVRRRAREPVG